MLQTWKNDLDLLPFRQGTFNIAIDIYRICPPAMALLYDLEMRNV